MRDFQIPTRSAAIAEHGMAATSHPEATLAALDVLREGGNALDAALAAVAVQGVVEPAMTGIGGDCFCLISIPGKPVIAFNGSGRTPAAAQGGWYREQGWRDMPLHSPHAVTVPGAVDAWCQLNRDYGTRPLERLFAPAIRLAEEGYRVTPRVAYDWAKSLETIRARPETAAAFLADGAPPAAGDRIANPALGATLRRISREGRAGFYEGPVAAEIVALLRSLGGFHEEADFARAQGVFVTPISACYRGYTVVECPPNGQGLAALMILRTLDGYDLSSACPPALRIHLLAEATKAGYHARDLHIGDPDHGAVDVEGLLSDTRIAGTRAHIRHDRTGPPAFSQGVAHQDTVCLSVVDRDRMAVSFINSIFHNFGSGIHAPGSGVLLHNRGASFRIVEGHPNGIGPAKRPMHTIIPGLVMKDGQALMPFGVMGGQYQATGHGHLLSQIFDHGLDPQQAIDTPRSFAHDGILELETTIPDAVAAELAGLGHRIVRAAGPMGGAQAIMIDQKRGVLIGGSDPRKDGMALGY